VNSSPAWGSFLSQLYATQLRKIDSAFEDLLDRRINISAKTRSKASDSQNHLRDFLVSEGTRDASFPRALSNADSDFLGGSFARHTKNWPLDDIDIYIPLDGAGLFYMENGRRLPYTVLSDGVLWWNPLCSDRWMNGQFISSAKLVSEFARVLARHYPRETEVRANGECVTVRMKQGQTTNSDGLGYDVVPCFLLKPDAPSEFEFYLMPNGAGGWQRTNPKLDTDLCEILNAFHNKIYRKVVKLVKYWNGIRVNSSFSSYYIEFAVSLEFWKLKKENKALTSISEGLAIAFGALERAFLAGDQTPWISGAPPIEKPLLTPGQCLAVSLSKITSELAVAYEKNGNDGEAHNQWASLFGDGYQKVYGS
jgi:hypothetical protein